MIDNVRVESLSIDYLEQLCDMHEDFDCFGLDCSECPFELEKPYKLVEYGHAYRCALAYAKLLKRRANK